MTQLKAYEITANGFDGSTDVTDDRVFWVITKDVQNVYDVIEGTGAKLWGELTDWRDQAIDYVIPRQQEEFRNKLFSFKQD